MGRHSKRLMPLNAAYQASSAQPVAIIYVSNSREVGRSVTLCTQLHQGAVLDAYRLPTLMTRAQFVHLHLRGLCSGLEGWPRPRQKHEVCQRAPSYLYKSLKRAHARSHHTSKQHTQSPPSELKRHTTSQVNTVRTVKRCESSSQYTECQFTCEYGATLRPICPKS